MPNSDDEKIDAFSRKTAEELIAQSFLPHIFAASLTVTRLFNRKEIPVALTDQESRALSKYTYFGWTAGLASGLGVFVTLFGGLRLAKHLATRRPSFLLSQSKHHAEMSQKRAEYSHLDQAVTKASSKPSGTLPPVPVQETSDTVMQIQFIFCSIISLWVATVAGNNYSDSHQVFNDNVAVLPLQTGTSILCERFLCPAVLTHHKNLQQQPMTYEMLHSAIQEDRRNKVRRVQIGKSEEEAETSRNPAATAENDTEHEEKVLWRSYDQDPLVPTPNEIYNTATQNTAVTAELESMQRLVYHCECRQAYAQKCRQHGQAIDPRTDLINVPVSTGVPLRFLTPTGQGEDTE